MAKKNATNNQMNDTINKDIVNHSNGHDSVEVMLRDLRLMILARQIDTKAMNLLRQGKTFFHIAGAGHEAIQVVVGTSLDP
ncbi:MAG: tungsten formylmethanofuran dehydrogenase, partial [Ignavibacteriaceae bacterium]|nr:tungsten formylmethanofuran dehydrogenase [Ignavibacteriaceae bacterium]